MQTVLCILATMGGYRRGLYLRVENPPYPALVLDAVEEPGPLGLPTLLVAHYHNALCQPEMHFEVSRPLWLRARLVPFRYRNDRIGVYQVARSTEGKLYRFDTHAFDRQQRFAALWDKRLRTHGYLEAFLRQRAQR
jgi:hypothetical protein